jgi:hypothetical protein
MEARCLLGCIMDFTSQWTQPGSLVRSSIDPAGKAELSFSCIDCPVPEGQPSSFISIANYLGESGDFQSCYEDFCLSQGLFMYLQC